MTDSDRLALLGQLIDHEALKLRVYKDSLGIETIGIGRNLRDKGITREEAIYLCDHDIDECVRDLVTFPWFVHLDVIRQRALTDLRFNLGPDRFRTFVKLIAALGTYRFADAARELDQSKWATQVQPARRHRLVTMLDTGTLGGP